MEQAVQEPMFFNIIRIYVTRTLLVETCLGLRLCISTMRDECQISQACDGMALTHDSFSCV